jgi:hypothetical protein
MEFLGDGEERLELTESDVLHCYLPPDAVGQTMGG